MILSHFHVCLFFIPNIFYGRRLTATGKKNKKKKQLFLNQGWDSKSRGVRHALLSSSSLPIPGKKEFPGRDGISAAIPSPQIRRQLMDARSTRIKTEKFVENLFIWPTNPRQQQLRWPRQQHLGEGRQTSTKDGETGRRPRPSRLRRVRSSARRSPRPSVKLRGVEGKWNFSQ